MAYQKLLFVSCLLFLTAACSSKNTEEQATSKSPDTQTIANPQFDTVAADRVFAYQCGDSLGVISYGIADSTWLFLPDTTLKMPRLESASGVKYKTGNYLYWTKGDEALLQLPEGSLMSCRLQPKKKSWAAAKLRGVDFRAMGQEPGWILEITEDEQIKYIGNYGRDTVYTPVPSPRETSGKTTYRAETNAHSLSIQIRDSSCTDAMNGAQFPATVHIQINGEKYKGCGKKLTN